MLKGKHRLLSGNCKGTHFTGFRALCSPFDWNSGANLRYGQRGAIVSTVNAKLWLRRRTSRNSQWLLVFYLEATQGFRYKVKITIADCDKVPFLPGRVMQIYTLTCTRSFGEQMQCASGIWARDFGVFHFF